MNAIFDLGSYALASITPIFSRGKSILHAAACLGIDYTSPLSEEEKRILKAVPYAYYATCLIASSFAVTTIYSAALFWKSASITAAISLVLCEELSRECVKIAKALSYLLPATNGQSATQAARQLRKAATFCKEGLWLSKIPFIHSYFKKIIDQIPPSL